MREGHNFGDAEVPIRANFGDIKGKVMSSFVAKQGKVGERAIGGSGENADVVAAEPRKLAEKVRAKSGEDEEDAGGKFGKLEDEVRAKPLGEKKEKDGAKIESGKLPEKVRATSGERRESPQGESEKLAVEFKKPAEKVKAKDGENKEDAEGESGKLPAKVRAKSVEKKEDAEGESGEHLEKVRAKSGESKENPKGESRKLAQKVRAKSGENAHGESETLAEKVRAKSGENKENVQGESGKLVEKFWAKPGQSAECESGKLEEEVRADTGEQMEGQVAGKSAGNKEKVGESVEFGGIKHIIIDIFENEILELGDTIDWNFMNFRNFDVVEGDAPQDHRFYYYSCNCKNSKTEKAWKILEKEFSGNKEERLRRPFFIRAYEGRKDLMRVAVAVSERELPYCHGLFFFDIKFPADYPLQPPLLFYHSYGRSVSPNLPKDGTISLRLPHRTKRFGLLDLFLHIQEIVLNPRVYPNDLSRKQKFVSTCLTMIDTLKRPPTGFEDFVKGHFRKNAAAVLRTFKEVMDMKDPDNRNLFFRLYIAFEGNKAYCEHLLDSDLRQELKSLKEKENWGESGMFPTIMSRFDSGKKSPKAEGIWSKLFP